MFESFLKAQYIPTVFVIQRGKQTVQVIRADATGIPSPELKTPFNTAWTGNAGTRKVSQKLNTRASPMDCSCGSLFGFSLLSNGGSEVFKTLQGDRCIRLLQSLQTERHFSLIGSSVGN